MPEGVPLDQSGHPAADCGVVTGAGAGARRQSDRVRHVGEKQAQLNGLRGEPAGADLVERFLDDTVECLCGVAGEVDPHVRVCERGLDVWAEPDGTLGALLDEDTTPLAGHDQAFIAQYAQRLLDGHPSDPVTAGQLGLRRQLLPRLELARQDRRAHGVRHLLVRRPRVVRVEQTHAFHGSGPG